MLWPLADTTMQMDLTAVSEYITQEMPGDLLISFNSEQHLPFMSVNRGVRSPERAIPGPIRNLRAPPLNSNTHGRPHGVSWDQNQPIPHYVSRPPPHRLVGQS